MRLRDKKTGEIYDVWKGNILVHFANGTQTVTFNTIAELNECLEDYKSPEPLIKDEKVRKAVRAWGYSPLTFVQHRRKGYCSFWHAGEYICFKGLFEGLKDGKLYTIAELCGEEE